jgi:hypothetical protein
MKTFLVGMVLLFVIAGCGRNRDVDTDYAFELHVGEVFVTEGAEQGEIVLIDALTEGRIRFYTKGVGVDGKNNYVSAYRVFELYTEYGVNYFLVSDVDVSDEIDTEALLELIEHQII